MAWIPRHSQEEKAEIYSVQGRGQSIDIFVLCVLWIITKQLLLQDLESKGPQNW